MIDFGHIVIIIKSERLDNTTIKQIAMFAIIGIGRYAFAIKQSAFRGAMEHFYRESVSVKRHAEIRRLFTQRLCPIIVTALNAVLFNASAEPFFDIIVRDMLPIRSYRVFAAFFLDELEQFAVRIDEFGARNHFDTSLNSNEVFPVFLS